MLLSLAVNEDAGSNIRWVASVLCSRESRLATHSPSILVATWLSSVSSSSHHLSSHLVPFTVTRTASTVQLPNCQLDIAFSSLSLEP